MFKKIIIYATLLYAIVGFILLPLLLKSQIVKIVQQETNSKLTLESIYFNPFIFNFQISGVELKSLDDKHLISLKSAMFDLEPHSLLSAKIHLKHFILEEPEISLVYQKDKSLNIAQIIKPTEQEREKEDSDSNIELPRVLLDKIAIVDGSVNYEDYSNPSKFDFSFHNIGFELTDIDTDDFNSSSAKLRFYSTLGDGGFVDLRSDIVGVKPLKMEGSLDFEASKLYTQWRYMQDSLNLEVADGKVAFHAEYNLNLDDLNEMTIDNLSLHLNNLRVKPKNAHKDVLNLETLFVKGVTIKPLKNFVQMEEFGVNSLDVKVARDEKGQVDWLEYIKMDSNVDEDNTTASVKKDSDAREWDVTLDKLSLQKVKVSFDDRDIKPNVKTSLNEFNLYAQNITLAGVEPLKYQMDMSVNRDLRCTSHGSLKHNVLSIESYSECKGFDLVHYRPYIDELAKSSLKTYDLKLQGATLGFDANVSVEDVNSEIIVNVNEANADIDKFALNKNSTNERVVNFDNFSVSGVTLNTKDKNVKIKKSTLKSLDIKTARLQDGSLNIDNIVVPLKTKKLSKKSNTKKEKLYSVELKHFAMQSAKVGFNDKMLTPSVKSGVDRVNLNVYNINSKNYSWLNYRLSMRVNSKGYVKTDGSLRHTPLKQKGKLELQRISLKEITPYIQESAFVSVSDGYLSLKSKLSYSKKENRPDLEIKGSLALDEFFVDDSRDNSALLSLSNLELKSFTLEMFPNRVFVDELDIDSFYVNAVVDENKSMNFASLVKKSDSNETVETVDENTTASKPDFPVKIMKINVLRGSAKFADLSLPIKFSTNIHDLSGVVYAVSNEPGETSYVDILGEVDKYGSTKLIGSVNSSDPKSYTDLDFNFRNLELSSYSGYSASFAGYEIDSGKLYLDLGYYILDSELLGKNSIMIKNIKLGKEVSDDTLPLGFVIALLEDSDGVIDINMPVEGNVDEPDFKYGALVMKTLGNLIVKAVTSPFRFLGSMMGMDGEALESLDFEPGLIAILPPEKEKLDTIAKMMIKRPKISLSIAGRYDADVDKLALQKQKLAKLVMLKSGDENRENQKNSDTIDLMEEIYEAYRDDDRLDAIKEKLSEKYKDETLERAYLIALTKECVSIQTVNLKELEYLATARAQALQNYLLNEQMIDSLRIKIKAVSAIEESTETWVKTKLEVIVE